MIPNMYNDHYKYNDTKHCDTKHCSLNTMIPNMSHYKHNDTKHVSL